MEKLEVIKHLQTDEQLYAAYAMTTNLPYVTCDEETFNDQAWVFTTEEEVKAFGKKCVENKIALMGRIIKRDQLPRFYGTLYAIGVNSVVFVCGEEQEEVELEEIAKKRDTSQLPENQRPLENPTLQLSGIYFMQELRRPVKMEEHPNLKELEEEFLVNLFKAQFLMAAEVVDPDPESEEAKAGTAKPQLRVPYLKDKNGKILQPVFSDHLELEKFLLSRKIKKSRITKVGFRDLGKAAIQMADAIVINPFGFNLPLTKEQLKQMLPSQEPSQNNL